MTNAPNLVPPPREPATGVVWVIAVAVLGLVLAACIYGAAKMREQRDLGARPSATSAS